MLLQRNDIVKTETSIGESIVLNVNNDGTMATLAEIAPNGTVNEALAMAHQTSMIIFIERPLARREGAVAA